MRLLADTHAALWYWMASPELSVRARNALGDPVNHVMVSAISIAELALKTGRGKLPDALPFLDRLSDAMVASAFRELPVHMTHGAALASLPDHHRDPFDRILVAQALAEDAVLVTRDAVLARYGVPVLW